MTTPGPARCRSRYEHLAATLLSRIRPAPVASALKRLMRFERRVVDTAVGRFWVDPISQFGAALLDDEYEPGMRAILEAYLHPGSVFVDAGANEGYFTVLAAALLKGRGSILAIEPQARLIPVLTRNLQLNRIEIASIQRVALGERAGDTSLYLSSDMNTGSSAVFRATKYALPVETVRSTTLEALLDETRVTSVDLLKMDIEGSEYEAILGSPGLFRERRIRAIALELHPHALSARGRSPVDITGFLEECGYRPSRMFGSRVLVCDGA